MMQVKDYDLIEEIAELLPIPRGYKILVACPQVEEKTEGGIIIAENTRNKESVASILGYVIELGEDAYFDSDKFPTAPYCKPGDWVMFRSYTGTRFKVKGHEFRLINDDSVEAIVEDPRSIERV
jgi:chaperonin GroES|uniref:Co-chaperonin GroES n=1 Tax=uncultured virus TaxID=340016 RepID=A0A221S3N4_9VIRU|nr:co-chaperonin GroES [uncultured virus]